MAIEEDPADLLTRAEEVERYIRNGIRPILLGKKHAKAPYDLGWPEKEYRAEHWAVPGFIVDGDYIGGTDQKGIGCNHAKSGTCVLDVDNEALCRLAFEQRGLDLDAIVGAGLQSIGNPANKLKAWFRDPAGLKTHKIVWPDPENPSKRIVVAEFRAAGAQDVLPPSTYSDQHGTLYEWVDPATYDLPVTRWPTPPAELLDVWQNFDSEAWVAVCPWAGRSAPKVDRLAKLRRNDNHVEITLFNQHVKPSEILEDAGYKYKGEGRWLPPSSTSKIPGLVEYEPGIFYGFNGSDILNDGRLHDAFDLFRILQCDGNWATAFKGARTRLKEAGVELKEGESAKGDDYKIWVKEDLGLARSVLYNELFVSKIEQPPLLIPGMLSRDAFGLASPGGVGKTTFVFNLMVRLCVGRPIGTVENEPMGCLYVTAEDKRSQIVYKLRLIAEGLGLSDTEKHLLASNLRLEIWTGKFRRLVVANSHDFEITKWCDGLARKYAADDISFIAFDPAIFFGPGEREGNDGMGTLMSAMSRLSDQFDDAAAGVIAHVSKEVARTGIIDQYAGRGGGAFADNSRGQLFLARHNDNDTDDEGGSGNAKKKRKKFIPPEGIDAVAGWQNRLYELHVTKMSHGPNQPRPWWLERDERNFALMHIHSPLSDMAVRARNGANNEAGMRAMLNHMLTLQAIRPVSESMLTRKHANYKEFRVPDMSVDQAKVILGDLMMLDYVAQGPVPRDAPNPKGLKECLLVTPAGLDWLFDDSLGA